MFVVTQLLTEIMPASKKAKQKLLGYFSRMNPTIELSVFGQNIRLNPDEKTPEETIMKLLMNLDDAAGELRVCPKMGIFLVMHSNRCVFLGCAGL